MSRCISSTGGLGHERTSQGPTARTSRILGYLETSTSHGSSKSTSDKPSAPCHKRTSDLFQCLFRKHCIARTLPTAGVQHLLLVWGDHAPELPTYDLRMQQRRGILRHSARPRDLAESERGWVTMPGRLRHPTGRRDLLAWCKGLTVPLGPIQISTPREKSSGSGSRMRPL